MAKRETFTDGIRQAILNCGMSRYRLAQLSKVPAECLHRFVHKQAGLSLDNLDRVARVLRLRVIVTEQPPGNK
ncbi:MAG: helix-turn-helix domain-containing protein [Pirellulales bacterium]|nr:helix-turn-helix domain-containing protein [Pirellulales bacterium]